MSVYVHGADQGAIGALWRLVYLSHGAGVDCVCRPEGACAYHADVQRARPILEALHIAPAPFPVPDRPIGVVL